MRLAIGTTLERKGFNRPNRASFISLYRRGCIELLVEVELSDCYGYYVCDEGWCYVEGYPSILTSDYAIQEYSSRHALAEALFYNSPFLLRDIRRIEGPYRVLLYHANSSSVEAYVDSLGRSRIFHSHRDDSVLLTNSLIQALTFQGALELDDHGVELYLTFQYLPSPFTPFAGVFQQSAGEGVRYRIRSTVPTREPISRHSGFFDGNETNPAQLVRTILEESLRYQLSSPLQSRVGAFLSGGLDSTANVALLANNLGVMPTTLTCSFMPDGFDEWPYAKQVVEKWSLDARRRWCDADVLDNLSEVVTLLDLPIGDRALLPQFVMCKEALAEGLRCVVSGEGGDELLDYPRHWSRFALPEGEEKSPSAVAAHYTAASHLCDDGLRERILGRRSDVGARYLECVYDEMRDASTPFELVYYGQWRTWLVGNVVAKDLSSIVGAGLEYINPYVTRRLMNMLAALPPTEKMYNLEGKRLLKNAIGDYFPPALLRRTKHKFDVPMADWLRNTSYMENILLRTDAKVVGRLFDQNVIAQVVKDHRAGGDYNRVLYAILILEVWIDQLQLRVTGASSENAIT